MIIAATATIGSTPSSAAALGHPEWAKDAAVRHATPARVRATRPTSWARSREIVATRTKGEWVDILEAAGVPCAPIHTPPRDRRAPADQGDPDAAAGAGRREPRAGGPAAQLRRREAPHPPRAAHARRAQRRGPRAPGRSENDHGQDHAGPVLRRRAAIQGGHRSRAHRGAGRSAPARPPRGHLRHRPAHLPGPPRRARAPRPLIGHETVAEVAEAPAGSGCPRG